MNEKTRNCFISHIHEDDKDVQKLKELVERIGFSIRDSSIDSSKPNQAKDHDYIKGEILAPRIRWASVVAVVISPGTSESSWVDWEIEYAEKLGKRIVGIWAHGAQEADLPVALERYGDALVGWNAKAIVRALEGTDEWQDPAGESRPPRTIEHYNC